MVARFLIFLFLFALISTVLILFVRWLFSWYSRWKIEQTKIWHDKKEAEVDGRIKNLRKKTKTKAK